jgi:hypothetical protein
MASPVIWVKRCIVSRAVNLFYGAHQDNQRAHHAPLLDDETTAHLGVIVMSLNSLMRSLLAAYACGASGAACEFSRPE